MRSIIAIALPLTSLAWTNLPARSSFSPPIHKTRCSLSSQPADNGMTDTTDNPCWQDIWNYDCAMSNIYSASFIAQDWIKSMPCAMGIVSFMSWFYLSPELSSRSCWSCVTKSITLNLLHSIDDIGLWYAWKSQTSRASGRIRGRTSGCNGISEFETSKVINRRIEKIFRSILKYRFKLNLGRTLFKHLKVVVFLERTVYLFLL